MDERMKRIIERQKQHEENLRKKEESNRETLKRKQEEEKKKEFENNLTKKQWSKDEQGKWIMISDKNLVVDYDPVKPPREMILSNTKQGSQIEIETSQSRWKKDEDGLWDISDEKMINERVQNSKEFHCYKSTITSSEIPIQSYKRLKIKNAMEREVDRTFAVDLLEVLIEKYFITSPISTQNAILRHILFLSKYFLSSFQPFEYGKALLLNRVLFQIRKLGEKEEFLPVEMHFRKKNYKECLEATEEAFSITNQVIEEYKNSISNFSESEIEDSLILSLPDEVLLQIFSYLPKLIDLYYCSLVSKNWNRIANDGSLYYTHVAKEFIYMKYTPEVNWKLQLRQIVNRSMKGNYGMSICRSCNSLYWVLDSSRCLYNNNQPHNGQAVDVNDIITALQTSPP